MATTEPRSKCARLGWFVAIWAASVAAMLGVAAVLRIWLV